MIYETLPTNSYCGNSSCKTFDFDFYIENENQLKVYLIDENEIKKELKYNEDYSINEFKNKSGSYIIFPIENSNHEILNENQRISLELNLEISQEVQYNNSSLLNLETLEYSLDYLTRLIQILNRKIALCLKVEEGLNATPDELFESIKSSATACIENKNIVREYKKITENVAQNTQEKLREIEKHITEITPEKYALNDFTNITNEGISIGASWAMPSDKVINLSMGATGSTYTAPADGYFYMSVSSQNQTPRGTTATLNSPSLSAHSTGYIPNSTTVITNRVILPVKKNTQINIQYITGETITNGYLRFIYAVGSESEAQ